MKKLTGKRGKIAMKRSEMSKEQKKAYDHANYLKRKTRGAHPKEIAKTGKTYPKRQGVGKVAKPIVKKEKKQGWNTAYYSSPLKSPGAEHIYFTMSSYDYMRTAYANYHRIRQKALFKLHKFFEEWIEQWENLFAEPQSFEELRFEFDSQPGDEEKDAKVNIIRADRKRFEWVMYDILQNPPEVLYFLQYQKGQILRQKLPQRFPLTDFQLSIQSWGLWE